MTEKVTIARSNDDLLLTEIEENIWILLKRTIHELAVDELTQALAHIRHSRRAIKEHDVNFYKSN